MLAWLNGRAADLFVGFVLTLKECENGTYFKGKRKSY